jgi:hypothetical protein
MGIFDASNRDQCEVRRGKTNTPLQALVMLNDPTVLEAARVLAQRLVTQNDPLTTAFRRIVGRRPTSKELQTLTDYYNDQKKLYDQKQLDANKTLDAGEYPHDPNTDRNKTAALMKTIELIYNLEETITRT